MDLKGFKNKDQILACLIIDDPLLTPRYGCLEYKILLQKMKEHNFFAEIAFIPWNYRRSEPKTVRLLADNPEYFSICIHGCNHTSNEFGDSKYEKLNSLAALAMDRMEEHRRITGLSYDRVMVFPQGRFSSMAILSLKNQGYRSAFNSNLLAIGGGELAAIEYKKPATHVYHNFPLFLRRYSHEKSYILQDMALGRPIILVEHPRIFKYEFKNLLDTIDWINEQGNIVWKSLEYITEFYCGKKSKALLEKKSFIETGNVKEHVRIALRRFACEIRDNYIEPNEFLMRLYKNVRKPFIKSSK